MKNKELMTINEQSYHISTGLKDCIEDLEFKRQHPNELRGISTQVMIIWI